MATPHHGRPGLDVATTIQQQRPGGSLGIIQWLWYQATSWVDDIHSSELLIKTKLTKDVCHADWHFGRWEEKAPT